MNSLSCCHADCQAACQASVSVGGLPETTSKWTTTGCRSARKTNIYIHTHICIRYIHMCVCVRWGHNMRDNLMSTPWRSLLLCPRRNVLIKIKRNFFDFDFIKCDLNELGHIFPQHTHIYIYIHIYSMCICMQCRLIKQTALCSRLRNIYNSAGRVYVDERGGVRGL